MTREIRWLTRSVHNSTLIALAVWLGLLAQAAHASPCIDYLSPSRADVGDRVTIVCKSERDRAIPFEIVLKPVGGGVVKTVAAPARWSKGKIRFTIPATPAGSYQVNLRDRASRLLYVPNAPILQVTGRHLDPRKDLQTGGRPAPGRPGDPMAGEVRGRTRAMKEDTDVAIRDVRGLPPKVAMGDRFRATVRVERDARGSGTLDLVLAWDEWPDAERRSVRRRSPSFSLTPNQSRDVAVDLTVGRNEVPGNLYRKTFTLEGSPGRRLSDANGGNNEYSISLPVDVRTFKVQAEVIRFYVMNDCDNGDEPGEWRVTWGLRAQGAGASTEVWNADLNDRARTYTSPGTRTELRGVFQDVDLVIHFSTWEDDTTVHIRGDRPGQASLTLPAAAWRNGGTFLVEQSGPSDCGTKPYAADVRIRSTVERP